MNTGTPLTGLKHAQFLVNLYFSYMDTTGHIMDGCFLYLKKITKERNHDRKIIFCSFVHIFTGGLPADGITAMVIKECHLLIYCVRLSMAL